jgi:hypothetical protein
MNSAANSGPDMRIMRSVRAFAFRNFGFKLISNLGERQGANKPVAVRSFTFFLKAILFLSPLINKLV